MTDGQNPGSPSGAGDAAAPAATLTASTIDLPRKSGVDPSEAGTPASSAAPYVGTLVDGRYLFERVLGEGGMGVVYAGRHKVIDKRVAIKVLRRDKANDQELNERFLQEARAASAVGNPHIVDISDFGTLADGSTYFVMELLEGISLTEAMARAKGPLPVARLCKIGKQIAEGLAAAHAANIVHRDLKPDNIMLVTRGGERDFAKILDFGIAKVGSATTRMTRAGSVFGTPHYMSPEQAAGTSVDHRTDVYALGVILYEMASGKVPFDADNFMGILTQHMYKAPVPIRALVPEVDVPPGLDAIVLKCLTKKPEGRYPGMAELIADLEKLEAGVLPDAVGEMMGRSGGFNVPADYFRSSGAMPAPLPASPLAPRPRWPLVVAVGAVGTLVGVIGVIVVAKGPSRAAPIPSVPTASAAVLPPPRASAVVALPTPISPPAPATREVLVSVTPADATIVRDGADLGGSPVALHLTDGEQASLVLSRKGYKTKTVHVTSADRKRTFSLEPIAAAVAPRASATTKASPLGGIDDVGDPFARRGR